MRLPRRRRTQYFKTTGEPVIWMASAAVGGPGHKAQIKAATPKEARRKGASALGVHHSMVQVQIHK